MHSAGADLLRHGRTRGAGGLDLRCEVGDPLLCSVDRDRRVVGPHAGAARGDHGAWSEVAYRGHIGVFLDGLHRGDAAS